MPLGSRGHYIYKSTVSAGLPYQPRRALAVPPRLMWQGTRMAWAGRRARGREADFSHSGTARPGPFGVDAAFMLLQLLGSGIHTV
jgi:hypothetical protein